MEQKELYGGALVVKLPSHAKDVSDFRQIPDNQEVFAHAVTDQSLIIEILEYVEGSDDDAISTHFGDLASDNDVGAEDCCIVHKETINPENLSMTQCSAAYYIQGKQNVAKFNESAKNTVEIHMGLFRLPQFESDILVTFNDPVNISPSSSSHHAVPTSAAPWTTDDFRGILTSFSIENEDIFGA
ncbi:hypothetical protein FSP39_016266 [Pinctada imbricata]|uniref:Ran guanine nucleotide release factor n=1 Tax=Pinctada imbricata TaxID=66713 RepID=A0AA88YGJ8_PINIB|nr:hypothetical protein FSP39_016266 [Pinctada imbricata]